MSLKEYYKDYHRLLDDDMPIMDMINDKDMKLVKDKEIHEPYRASKWGKVIGLALAFIIFLIFGMTALIFIMIMTPVA